ncbi:MAG: hypothetical protein AB8G99_03475, partial [Planctomycetaceae bacterium]
GDEEKIELCPNWLVGELEEITRSLSTQNRATPKPAPKLLYCGNIGQKQGLLDLCKHLQQSDLVFDFEIRGDGTCRGELDDWLAKVRDKRFRLGGFLETSAFMSSIRGADLFVTCEKPSAGFSFIPSKLIPSISIGTPILAVSDITSPLGQEVIQHRIGIHVAWDDVEQLPNHLVEFSSRRQWYQDQCLTRAKYYSRGPSLDRYESLASA